VVLDGNVDGRITGTTFENFGPSGPAHPARGNAKVAADGNVGYAIRLNADLSGYHELWGNTFSNVQGIFFDARPAELAMTPRAFIDNIHDRNNLNGRRYIVPGSLDNANHPFIYGQRHDDPNMLNYVLSLINSNRNVHLGAGSYALDSCMISPSHAVFLQGT
jgi:hypothetical protein